MVILDETTRRRSQTQPPAAPSPLPLQPARPSPAAQPSPSLRARLREDPTLHTAWAVHPCAEYDERRNRPGPWFQFRHPDGFEWNCVSLPVPNLPRALEGLRIVHVSDFHLRRDWTPAYDKLLRRIARSDADLLICTGDYVEDKKDFRPALPMAVRLVSGFRARLGCFGILGNHDRYRMAPALTKTGVVLLDGARRELEIVRRRGAGRPDERATIELVGLPGVRRGDLTDDVVDSDPRRRDGTLRVVLSHFPDHLPRVQHALQPDLFLTGHTHGGQVCLPGGIPVIRHDTMPRRLCTGIHWVDRTWLVVNRGFGFSGMPVRMFCPAEVLEIRLTRMT